MVGPKVANKYVVGHDALILVTGANGFIGAKVVETLLVHNFKNLRCFIRSTSISPLLKKAVESSPAANISIVRGNLLSASDCKKAVDDVKVIYHLAAPTKSKSLSEAHDHAVSTSSNLLDAALRATMLTRIVNVSSFSVYSNMQLPSGALLDESCPIETEPELRSEAYCFAKLTQEALVREYGTKYQVPYVIVRPGAVFGPGNRELSSRVGMVTRGLFLHMGGSNLIPFTFVDNCAEAIVLAGLQHGIDGEVINVVDDCLPTSKQFLKRYKEEVGNIRSVYVPKCVSFAMFSILGTLSAQVRGGLPTKYNRRRWSAYWKGNTYSNDRAKQLLSWAPRVSMAEGMERYFAYCKIAGKDEA